MELNFGWLAHEYVAVHCDTKEKAKEFIKKAHEAGCQGMESHDLWEIYGQDTCYEIDQTHVVNDIYYSNIGYFIDNHYEVIEYELDKQETPLPKLCELLGVGVNEEFTLANSDGYWTYKISDDGKLYYKCKFSDWEFVNAIPTDILYDPSLIVKVKKYPDLTPDDKTFLNKMYEQFGDADIYVTDQKFNIVFYNQNVYKAWSFPIDFFNGLEAGMKFKLSELLEV